MVNNPGFSYSFTSSKTPSEVFDLLLHIDKWWSGLYAESITGESKAVGDEFSFRAGEGMHYSKQKLVELIPDKKIVWQVTESNLRFLHDQNEWANTKLCFDLSAEEGKTKITFTHVGLLPQIECYDSCSNAWTQYLTNLKANLS